MIRAFKISIWNLCVQQVGSNSMENILAVLVKDVREIRLLRVEFWIKLLDPNESKLDSCRIILQNKISNVMPYIFLCFYNHPYHLFFNTFHHKNS